MDPRLQRRVQRYGWDRASGHYGRFWSEQLRPAQELLLSMASAGPGERALDVACGPGDVTFPLAEAVGAGGSVLGVDLSQAMVDLLRTEAEARGLRRVEARRMGAEALDLDDASFDLAVSSLGLMYPPDPLAAVGEMRRVARPGGRVVSAVWGERDRCGWAEIFPIVDSRVRTEVCPLFFRLGSGDTQERVFAAAGLEELASERIRVVLAYDTAEDAVGAAFVGGPVALAHSRFDGSTREAAHAEYLESIEPYRRGDGYEIPGEFVVTRGVRPG